MFSGLIYRQKWLYEIFAVQLCWFSVVLLCHWRPAVKQSQWSLEATCQGSQRWFQTGRLKETGAINSAATGSGSGPVTVPWQRQSAHIRGLDAGNSTWSSSEMKRPVAPKYQTFKTPLLQAWRAEIKPVGCLLKQRLDQNSSPDPV